MAKQRQPASAGLKQQLDEVILSLQRLQTQDTDGNGDGNGNGGLSTQSNGCSTYSIHCGGTKVPEVVAPR
jgi:hypothetical protein